MFGIFSKDVVTCPVSASSVPRASRCILASATSLVPNAVPIATAHNGSVASVLRGQNEEQLQSLGDNCAMELV